MFPDFISALVVAFTLGWNPAPSYGAQSGIASFYSVRSSGARTASGERLNDGALTAAHKTLPFGTLVRVTADSGRSIVVKITDRGPFVKGRIIDLTPAGARALGIGGTAHVTIQAINNNKKGFADWP